MGRQTERKKRDPKLAWEAQESFHVAALAAAPTVKLHLHSQFTADIKTPYSNLTAEVEWWQGSSRVPCSTHRILMAVRQRPQAVGLFYKLRPILLSIAPCWHAITQTVSDICLFFSLLILSLTSLFMFISSSRKLFLTSDTYV